MKRRSWQVLFLALAALLALALVLPVSAKGPEKIVVPYENDYQITGVCEFPIQVADRGTLTISFWYDDLGVSRELVNFNRGTTTYTGLSEATLTPNTMGQAHFQMVRRDEDGSMWVSKVATGPSAVVVLPGQGPIYGSTGRVESLLHLAENGTLLSEELVSRSGGEWSDPEALCAYLGG